MLVSVFKVRRVGCGSVIGNCCSSPSRVLQGVEEVSPQPFESDPEEDKCPRKAAQGDKHSFLRHKEVVKTRSE